MSAELDPLDPTKVLVDPLLARLLAKQRQWRADLPPPVRLRVEEAARISSMSVKALRHKIQRSQFPRGVVIHDGRAVFLDRERFLNAIRKDRT